MTKTGKQAVSSPALPVTPFRTDLARHREQAAEIERLMTNWARWKSGVSMSVAISGAYDLEARGRREAGSVPLLNGEASDVDAAVSSLPAELYDVVTIHWLGQKRDQVRKSAVQVRSLSPSHFRGEDGRAMHVTITVPVEKLEPADQELSEKLQGRVVQAIGHAPLKRAKVSTDQQRARAAGCSVRTYYRRLAHAHERITALMLAKRREQAASRQQFRAIPRNNDTTTPARTEGFARLPFESDEA